MSSRTFTLAQYAEADPDKLAVILPATGETLDYGTLEAGSRHFAAALAASGVEPGDHVAILVESRPELFEILWGCQRAGVHFTPMSGQVTADEATYVVNDCRAKVLFASVKHAETAQRLVDTTSPQRRISVGGSIAGHVELGEWIDAGSVGKSVEVEGAAMVYSSGTTGRPKGVKRTLSGKAFGEEFGHRYIMQKLLGYSDRSVYLSTAPLYHAAPLSFLMGVHRLGGTSVVMRRFDAEDTLRYVDKYRVTHAQFVPTMFVRLLKLPAEVRDSYHLDSLESVVHSAAPCPAEVKRQMIDWWGPIISEYYSGTERSGVTFVTAAEWLTRPGTVGRPIYGAVHIVDSDGAEVEPGIIGRVFFSGGDVVRYHNDPTKTQRATDQRGWSTLGDIGRVDEEGYLFLTDREDFVIIRGGANIYSQEIEDVLIQHPKVDDVAVIGIPDPELGQKVKAFVQATPDASPEGLIEELDAFCRTKLATYKVPETFELVTAVPRRENGKLYKKALMQVSTNPTSDPA